MVDTDTAVPSEVEEVVKRLKRIKAISLRVLLSDGSEKNVVIAKDRNRWTKVRGVLTAMDWIRVDALDAKGGTLECIESELDDLDDVGVGGDLEARLIAAVAGLVKINLSSQKMALDRQSAQQKDLLDAAVTMVKTMSERLVAIERMYDARLKLFDKLAGEGIEPELQSTGLLEALAPYIAQQMVASQAAGNGKAAGASAK